MIDWFGPVIDEMYGASEGAGPAIRDSHEWLAHPGTVGKASARVEYSIVDDEDVDLPPGEIGTIYCRRDDGAPEYYGDPDKTDSTRLDDGRFTVGDIGWLDDDGYLYLADRRVDPIVTEVPTRTRPRSKRSSSNTPRWATPRCSAFPTPDWRQQVEAVIEPAGDESIDVDDVRALAAARLAAFEVPGTFDVIDALPREAHGKLKKRLLREPYWQ